MTIIRPRGRPRVRSVDFSRLWWLVATEAAFQVLLHCSRFEPTWDELRRLKLTEHRQLSRLRRDARSWLATREVFV